MVPRSSGAPYGQGEPWWTQDSWKLRKPGDRRNYKTSWKCRVNFEKPTGKKTQLVSVTTVEKWLRKITSPKSQTRDSRSKISPGGLVLRIFTSWNNPSTSAGFEPAKFRSRVEHLPRGHRSRHVFYLRVNSVVFLWEYLSLTGLEHVSRWLGAGGVHLQLRPGGIDPPINSKE